ncbi:heterokaryon incompatibility protein [Colletotrichum karsti]|uniref:Heterokaryon incompatibility protein n=1 Tax=Colletotrichum karsti TaxID=1095194 RepID=A0A9P6HV20_9PEZI|nr:heterokaryon incompatibility protein [Colletotrichum karsti]KAF9871838.1 heterokaryon incompatibility protein [Colletotrichum karsti]
MYHYAQLPSERFIRLVNIVRDASSQHGFSLRLTTHSLSDLPPFWALSYTWGSPDFLEDGSEDTDHEERCFQIECDGHDLHVGETLFDFLRHTNQEMVARSELLHAHSQAATLARRLAVPERKFNFWIDAICIDQTNHDERSNQVRLMGEIYQSAHRVIAWLGSKQPNDNVQWVIRKFAPWMLHLSRSPTRSQVIKLLREVGHEMRRPDAEELVGAETCERWRRSYTDFFAFFARKRWLTRGWVVQEAAIPGRHAVIIQCGSSQFSWTTINAFATFILDVGWEDTLNERLNEDLPAWRRRPGTIERLWNPVSSSLPDFRSEVVNKSMVDWQNRRWGAVTDEHVRHAEVLHNFHRLRFYEFQNPVDHIYGTLGLMPLILGPKYPLGIRPSYEVPVDQAFIDVASWLIPHLPNLDVLGLAGVADGRRQGLPSWVPDFSFHGPEQYTSLQRLRQRRMKHARWYGPLDATRTSSISESPTPFARVDGNMLRLEGIQIDTIELLRKLEHDDQGIIRNISWIVDFCDRKGSYAMSNESFAEVVVKTLTADIRPRAISKKDYDAREDGWVRDCITYNWLLNKSYEDLELPRQSENNDSNAVDKSQPFITVDEALHRASQEGLPSRLADDPITKIVYFVTPGRQILKTQSGLLGLAPCEAQIGDEIWLVKGGRMPLILRRSQAGSYVLVGEVYVHGIMHGEMFTNELQAKFREVVLI